MNRFLNTLVLPLLVLVVFGCSSSSVAQDWTQWGGENRDFRVDGVTLSDSWPEGGPEQLWSRPLGEGYSTVLSVGGRLYTMYRPRDGKEAVIAMDAKTGKTIWEHTYDAPELAGQNYDYGPGPHSSPLVVGDSVFAVGGTGKFHALDRNTGEVLWKRDFHEEFGIVWRRGYGCSPIADGDNVVVAIGGKGQALLSMNQSDGSTVWQKHDFEAGSASTPIYIDVDGQRQMVFFMGAHVIGVEPGTGDLLWQHDHVTQGRFNISTPVWGDDNLLFVSSAYNGGSRVIRLKRDEGRTTTEELWFSNQMRIHIGNAFRIGDYVYGTNGDFGPAFFTAIHVRTGKVAWRDRGFSKISAVLANDKLIVVDEDGDLALISVSPEGMTVHARAAILESNAWTAPTLVGSTLYVRDRKVLRAFSLN